MNRRMIFAVIVLFIISSVSAAFIGFMVRISVNWYKSVYSASAADKVFLIAIIVVILHVLWELLRSWRYFLRRIRRAYHEQSRL